MCAANPNIRMISEGSCDWSNDDKIQLWNHNKLHFKIYSNRKQLFKKSIYVKKKNHCFYCILNQINAGLVNRRDLFKIKLYLTHWFAFRLICEIKPNIQLNHIGYLTMIPFWGKWEF